MLQSRRSYLTLIVLISFLLVYKGLEQASAHTPDEIGSKKASDKEAKTVSHDFYFGAKVGVIYLVGLELNYILETHEVNRFYLALAVQTSLVVNSANAGGGIFLGKTGLGLGCRYHHLLWFDAEPEHKIQPGYGPEIIYNKTIGTRYIINLHAGGIITKGSFFPDISFGVFLPLN